MNKGRMEAFSDGVLAILITIMVLGLQKPAGDQLSDLVPLIPTFASYVLSFALLGIYWNNHHHILQASKVVDGRVLWANLHLLFWLSLVPFATIWMGETTFAATPTAVYCFVLLGAAIGFYLLVHSLVTSPGQSPELAAAIGRDNKGIMSPVLYAIGIPVSLFAPLIGFALCIVVVGIWIVPDLRVERVLATARPTGDPT
jgi:uncharacterized membrane protein